MAKLSVANHYSIQSVSEGVRINTLVKTVAFRFFSPLCAVLKPYQRSQEVAGTKMRAITSRKTEMEMENL